MPYYLEKTAILLEKGVPFCVVNFSKKSIPTIISDLSFSVIKVTWFLFSTNNFFYSLHYQ